MPGPRTTRAEGRQGRVRRDRSGRSLHATGEHGSVDGGRSVLVRGGKLVLYHGWNDPAISALSTIGYYGSVVGRLGRQETS